MIKITAETTTIITTIPLGIGGFVGVDLGSFVGFDVVGAGVSKINDIQRIEDDGFSICHNSYLKISSSLKSLYLRCLRNMNKYVRRINKD